MSKARSSFLVLFALSSVCFGAGLMQYSMAPKTTTNFNCEEYLLRHPNQDKQRTVLELYKEAFKLSFNGQAISAQKRSECAAILDHGSQRWNFELKDLL